MKLLVCHPGASYATGDVHVGYMRALVEQGHRVIEYDLCSRIDEASDYYKAAYRRRKMGKPPWELVLTRAAMDLIPQALYHDVDWVIVVSGMYFAPDLFVLLRRAGKRVALLGTESPYDDDKMARVIPWCDLVFTNERASVAALRRVNPNTHYLACAYDPARSNARWQVPDDTPRHDVLFLGTMFEERIDLLAAVDWTGIDFAIYGAAGLLPSRHKLRQYIRGGIVDNRTAQQMYRAAKINLNPYRTSKGYGRGVEHISGAESLNPRALELAACGAFQISDYREEVWDVFGQKVPTYTDAADMERIIRSWLPADEFRREIGQRCRDAVQYHTYAHRAEQLTATLAAHGASRTALAAD